MRAAMKAALMLTPLMLAACGGGDAGGTGTAPPVTPSAKVVGAARDCIPINQIRETRIRDDSTIDFVGNGGDVWRVTLANMCPQLKSENKFTYETSLSQLCSTDIIYVLHDYGGSLQRGAGCGLSRFVPVELTKQR